MGCSWCCMPKYNSIEITRWCHILWIIMTVCISKYFLSKWETRDWYYIGVFFFSRIYLIPYINKILQFVSRPQTKCWPWQKGNVFRWNNSFVTTVRRRGTKNETRNVSLSASLQSVNKVVLKSWNIHWQSLHVGNTISDAVQEAVKAEHAVCIAAGRTSGTCWDMPSCCRASCE